MTTTPKRSEVVEHEPNGIVRSNFVLMISNDPVKREEVELAYNKMIYNKNSDLIFPAGYNKF